MVTNYDYQVCLSLFFETFVQSKVRLYRMSTLHPCHPYQHLSALSVQC